MLEFTQLDYNLYPSAFGISLIHIKCSHFENSHDLT